MTRSKRIHQLESFLDDNTPYLIRRDRRHRWLAILRENSWSDPEDLYWDDWQSEGENVSEATDRPDYYRS